MAIPTEKKIEALAQLGRYILYERAAVNALTEQAFRHNKWFTPDNVNYALKAIASEYLEESKLRQWLAGYSIPEYVNPKRVGLIMAGNIPLAGFHDFLCVLLTHHHAVVKLSSKDDVLLPFLAGRLCAIEPSFREHFEFAERLTALDAVIATGSNNSSRYFEYYFGKYPHIFRKNRNSIAILSGRESRGNLMHLGDDIFLYFGMGCRNVSKIYVPTNFQFDVFLQALSPFSTLLMHDGYRNNYDYQRAVLLMNNIPHYANEFMMLRESASFSAPLATLHFEYYDDLFTLKETLSLHSDKIQCIVGNEDLQSIFPNIVPWGKSQRPALHDFADGVDTMRFLTAL